jgi:nicotinamide mononucleotide transporter
MDSHCFWGCRSIVGTRYPTGIIGTVLGIYILMNVKLYAECLLSGYYIVMSFYGWYYWIKKADKPPVEVTWSTRQEWLITLTISLGGTVVLYYTLTTLMPLLFKSYTPSNVPLWDAWVSATAWAGMWLLARRKIENWALLNLSNVFAVPLLFYKKLPLSALLVVFLFIIGTWGFFDWIKIYNKKNAQLAEQPPAEPFTI